MADQQNAPEETAPKPDRLGTIIGYVIGGLFGLVILGVFFILVGGGVIAALGALAAIPMAFPILSLTIISFLGWLYLRRFWRKYSNREQQDDLS